MESKTCLVCLCGTILSVCLLWFSILTVSNTVPFPLHLEEPHNKETRPPPLENPFAHTMTLPLIEFLTKQSEIFLLEWERFRQFPSNRSQWRDVVTSKVIAEGCLTRRYIRNGVGDGGRWFCGSLKGLIDRSCTIVSVGSNNQWEFEEHMFLMSDCAIDTYDCTNHSLWAPPPLIQTRVRYISQCITSLQSFVHSYHVSVLKMDIEQNEFPSIESLESLFSNHTKIFLPWQLLIEVHWWNISPERFASFWKLLHQWGYVFVAWEPNPGSIWCVEATFLLLQ